MKMCTTCSVHYTLYFVQCPFGCSSSLVQVLVQVIVHLFVFILLLVLVQVLVLIHELVFVILLVHVLVVILVFLLSLPLNALEPGCLVLAAHEEAAPPGSVDVQPDTVALTDVWREQVS